MNKYLLQDVTDNVIPVTIVYADDKLKALLKAMEGIIKDKILSIEDVCESLGISLEEITNIRTYE